MSKLVIQDLHLQYGDRTILSDVQIKDVEPGSVIGVLGPNGVGKSTFLRALAGLNDYRGSIHLNGEDISDMPFAQRAGLVGYLPQTLPQGTTLLAYEAVISACRAVRPDLTTQTVETMVEEIFDVLGIRRLVMKPLNQMSGGERQMVGLAQVIVRKPDLLLLDEPTSALDLRWQISVLGVVKDIVKQKGGVCLVAIHDINLALRHCDQIAVFAMGGIKAFGPPENAMTADILRSAFRVDGRLETCSKGSPFIVTDGALPKYDTPKYDPPATAAET